MASRVKVWFDKEADYLEVLFSDRAGYMRETDNDAILERIDQQGNLLGFAIFGVSKITKDQPLIADLMANYSDAALQV